MRCCRHSAACGSPAWGWSRACPRILHIAPWVEPLLAAGMIAVDEDDVADLNDVSVAQDGGMDADVVEVDAVAAVAVLASVLGAIAGDLEVSPGDAGAVDREVGVGSAADDNALGNQRAGARRARTANLLEAVGRVPLADAGDVNRPADGLVQVRIWRRIGNHRVSLQ